MKKQNIVISKIILKVVFIVLTLCANTKFVYAQQYKMGKNINNIKSGVLLELEDTEKALLLTRVSNPAISISTPYRGMIVFDSIVNQLAYYNGTEWKYPILSLPPKDTSIYNSDAMLQGDRTLTMNANHLIFNSTNGNLIFTSMGTGKMGIGIHNPISALQVKGAVRTDSIVLQNLSAKTSLLVSDSFLMATQAGVVKKTVIDQTLGFDVTVNTGDEFLLALADLGVSSIFLNSGLYTFNTLVNIPNHINRIVGSLKGNGVTFLFNYTGTDAAIYCITLNGEFIEFSNIKIEANIPNGTGNITLIGETSTNTNIHNIKNFRIQLTNIQYNSMAVLQGISNVNNIDKAYVSGNGNMSAFIVNSTHITNCIANINGIATGFVNCNGILNSSSIIRGTGDIRGYNGCTNVVNATATMNATGTTSYGFFNCSNLTNCIANVNGNTYASGFENCSLVVNSQSTVTSNSSSYGFINSLHITNSQGTGNGNTGYGFSDCSNLIGCQGIGNGTSGIGYGFISCTIVNSCIGKGNSNSNSGYGFSNCKAVYYCQNDASKTSGYISSYTDFLISNSCANTQGGGWNR